MSVEQLILRFSSSSRSSSGPSARCIAVLHQSYLLLCERSGRRLRARAAALRVRQSEPPDSNS